MCELFGVSSSKKLYLNEFLTEFFSHGEKHPNGWGMAFFYDNAVSLEKQPESAHKSAYLKQRLQSKIEADNLIAHIRFATRGGIQYENTHPFVMRDKYNRSWTLAHNGTLFESTVLSSLKSQKQGQTDSESILAYIVDQINAKESDGELTQEERFQVVQKIIKDITPENKVNVLIFDGELLYVHSNDHNSLYRRYQDKAVILSTSPLDHYKWECVPINTVLAYKDGNILYTGTPHQNTFIRTEEKMKHLFLDYAGL